MNYSSGSLVSLNLFLIFRITSLPVPKKRHQSGHLWGWGRFRWACNLAASDFYLRPLIYAAEWHGDSFWATGGHCLIGQSVAHMQETGVNVAESDTDLLTWSATAVAHWPGPEANENFVHRVGIDNETASMSRLSTFCRDPEGIKSESCHWLLQRHNKVFKPVS